MKLYCDTFTSRDLFLAFRDVGDHFVLHHLHNSMMDFKIVQQFEQKHSFATMFFGLILLANFFNLILFFLPFALNFWYLGQRKYRYGKMYWTTSPWPWPKVMAVALINKNLLVCTRTTQPIITELDSYIPLVMLVIPIDFGEILLKTFLAFVYFLSPTNRVGRGL